MRISKDSLIAIALLTFNLVYMLQALKLPVPFEHGEPGPAFFPLVLSAVLFVSSLVILFKGLQLGDEKGEEETEYLKPALVVGATAVFVVLLNYLGYWIATMFYTFSIALVFEYRRNEPILKTSAFCALISAAITVFGWLFFVKLFDLYLPKGVL